MLFKISFNNIRKSVRDYAIYFFTLVIGVSVFYVFNAIETQTAFLKVSESTKEIIELLASMLSGVSVFVSVVLGLLIVYASRFLMKRRNKEFALYLTLGMGKGKISAILFFETLIVGFVSLSVGLFVGIGLSQLMSAFVANLFEADMTSYKFTLSLDAVLKTLIYFGIMYLAVMIFNSFIISKFKLIDLINSGKKSEKLRLKNPILCVVIFIMSAAALSYAYYRVGWNAETLDGKATLLMIVIGSVATFFIFWSMSGMLLRIMMSVKKVYFRGLNSFTFRQVSSKVNTMVMSMTVICLMLFVTICSLSSAFTIRNSMNANLKELCPADCELILINRNNYEILDCFDKINVDFTRNFKEYVTFNVYRDEAFTFEEVVGDGLEELKQQYRFLITDVPEDIVKLSDYNNLMKLYGKEGISLKDDEFAVICDFSNIKKIRDLSLSSGSSVTIFGKSLKSKYSECLDGFIDLSAQHINGGFYIVPDSLVDEKAVERNYFIGNYNANSKEDKANIEKLVNEDVKKLEQQYSDSDDAISCGLNTRIDVAEASIGLGAIVTFLGLYIGIVFLISCGAVLALKELSEDVDSIPRYEMLRKIGADERDISKSLLRQTGIFFLIPMLLACIHSVFGMKFSVAVFEVLGTEKSTSSIVYASLIILMIYGGYFLVTYFCGKGIIKERK